MIFLLHLLSEEFVEFLANNTSFFTSYYIHDEVAEVVSSCHIIIAKNVSKVPKYGLTEIQHKN